MRPLTLDHVALWVAGRDAIAEVLTTRTEMHVIERTDRFTLLGADARRGKLTLFDAEGPREPGPLARIGLRVASLPRRPVRVRRRGGTADRARRGADGRRLRPRPRRADDRRPRRCPRRLEQLGFAPLEDGRLEVGGAYLLLEPGEPVFTEQPLLNHIGVLVESVDEHVADAEDLGVEVDGVVDAPNTIALFVWGPERVKLEYVEHKPTFSLS